MAAEIGIWAVPLTAFVSFTLYGIEGIAQSYEDPFGRVAKTDINVDDIVEDARQEVEVLLFAWQTQGRSAEMDGLFRSRTTKSTVGSEMGSGANSPGAGNGLGSQHVKFAIRDGYRDDEGGERVRGLGRSRLGSAISPGERSNKASVSEEYFGNN